MGSKLSINVIAYYCQWNLPRDIDINISDNNITQITRYNNAINIFNDALKLNKDLIIMCDDNVDTLNNNSLINNTHASDIKDVRDQFLIDSNIIVHNTITKEYCTESCGRYN